jgi:2-haloacid dehalogenase/putative hydrolase of the HAD superfamily
MAIKALFMDFYGTLVRENDGVIRDVCRRVCETTAQVVAPGDVAHFWWETMNGLFREHQGDAFLTQTQLEELALEEVTARFESHLNIPDTLSEVLASLQKPEAFSDARALFNRNPLPVCVVANGDHDPLVAAVRYAQIPATAVVTSEDARAYKPSEEIFRHALEALSVKPNEALFVGDSIYYDMQPAQNAGMFTAWVNRNGRALGGRCLPDVTCDNLQQLRRMIH